MEYKGIANNNMVLSIPEGSQRIADLAFNGMSSIVSVEFPDSLVNIGNGSFAGCENLKSLNIPKNVTTIENDAFYYCTKLESVIISDGVKTIDDSAFYGCSSLKNIVIPASVTKIGKTAFGYESDWWFEKIDLCIYGFKNSAAEKYATENGLEFCSISYISTEGIVFTDENAQPEINKITDGEIFENTKTQLEEASLLAIYDIATNSDEKSMIKIPTKSPSIKLYFINADGTLSDTNAVYENGYLTLQNSNGGRFALTKIKKDINNDGIIDVKDVTILQMHLVGYSVGADVNNIDINQDGIIDINDVTNLQFILSNSDVASNPSR